MRAPLTMIDKTMFLCILINTKAIELYNDYRIDDTKPR